MQKNIYKAYIYTDPHYYNQLHVCMIRKKKRKTQRDQYYHIILLAPYSSSIRSCFTLPPYRYFLTAGLKSTRATPDSFSAAPLEGAAFPPTHTHTHDTRHTTHAQKQQ